MPYLAVTALSHDGLVRDHNEDSLVVGPWSIGATTTLTPQTLIFPLNHPVVVAVSDGLGGHPSGDVASTVVVQALARVGPSLSDEDAVRKAVRDCNDAVYDEAALDAERQMMGTTVAGVVVSDGSVMVFNVGDSRVYALDGSSPNVVSVDDSPPLAPGESHTVIVTQTLGGNPSRTPVEPHVSTRQLADAARYLICTDGLSDVVSADDIHKLVADRTGPEAVFELWKAAMEGGGPDNITIALVELVAGGDDD